MKTAIDLDVDSIIDKLLEVRGYHIHIDPNLGSKLCSLSKTSEASALNPGKYSTHSPSCLSSRHHSKCVVTYIIRRYPWPIL
jgi:hypothetical protein